jgi:hypothetical protein
MVRVMVKVAMMMVRLPLEGRWVWRGETAAAVAAVAVAVAAVAVAAVAVAAVAVAAVGMKMICQT